MQTFAIPAPLGVKQFITLDSAVLRVKGPGQDVEIPWPAIRGLGLGVTGGRYTRRSFLVIGYDAPGAPAQEIALHVANPSSPDMAQLATALHQRRLWRGAGGYLMLRKTMGLSNRRAHIALAVSAAVACLVALIVAVLAT